MSPAKHPESPEPENTSELPPFAEPKPVVDPSVWARPPAQSAHDASHEQEDSTEVLPTMSAAAEEETVVLPTVPATTPEHSTHHLTPAANPAPAPTTVIPTVLEEAPDTHDNVTEAINAPDTVTAQEAGPNNSSSRTPRRKFTTLGLMVVVIALLVVVGTFTGEFIARRLLIACTHEAARYILHTDSEVEYDHRNFLLGSLAGHTIPYLKLDAHDASIDKFDSQGKSVIPQVIKGLHVSTQLKDIYVTKEGASVGYLTAHVLWDSVGIRKTLLHNNTNGILQEESPITAINSIRLDTQRNEFVLDVEGKVGPVQSQAVITVHPQIDKERNLKIKIRSIDFPKLHNIGGLDVTPIAEAQARPVIEKFTEQIAGYPLGLKAQSVRITSEQIIFDFYAQDAPLVQGIKCSSLRWLE